jgi:CheY-like chemotaxis protein
MGIAMGDFAPTMTARRRRVLIVDDEPLARSALRRLIESCGVDTVLAAGADEALALLRRGEVDAVLTDLDTPHQTGVRLARDLRTVDRTVPLLLLSSRTDHDPSLAEGLVAFVRKPAQRDQVDAALRAALDASDQLRRRR